MEEKPDHRWIKTNKITYQCLLDATFDAPNVDGERKEILENI